VLLPRRDSILPKIGRAPDHIIAGHVVTAGRCSGTMAGEEVVALEAGEAIIFTNGGRHIMSNSPGVEAPATKQVVVEIAAANKRSLYINRGSDEPFPPVWSVVISPVIRNRSIRCSRTCRA